MMNWDVNLNFGLKSCNLTNIMSPIHAYEAASKHSFVIFVNLKYTNASDPARIVDRSW